MVKEREREGRQMRRERETEVQSYHVNETLLDPVQRGSQSAADKAQTR